MRTLFYGTPAVAVPFLELVARKTVLAGVLTGPDQPAGRGLLVRPGPVKAKALELGVPVFQPQRPIEAAPQLRALEPDLSVAVAYGKLLPAELLAAPRLGTLNVHFSLLPKYRGAAPVQWSLVNGERRAGVTVFWLVAELDAGPVFTRRETDVGPDEDAGSLFERLTALGLEALAEALDRAAAGSLLRQPQAGEPSWAPRLRREDARVTFAMPAGRIHNLARGLRLWPTAFMELRPPAPRLVRLLKTRLPGSAEAAESGTPPGGIVAVERGGGILVECMDRSQIWILTVQPEGKKPVCAADFINGLRLGVGRVLPLA
ncbi:MAG: methionyl-tRNA formyltransferase [Elusimicrobia bacterium]|nr:methionyl-tRNA formyltransferase [Elusimicrobiota bacterium]